jgi:hypothetical protein
MSTNIGGFCLATIVFAGGFSLATVDRAAADSATSKCAIEWKQAKANGTTGGKSWKEFFDQCGADQNGLSRSISLTPAEPKPAADAAVPTPATPAAPQAPVAAATEAVPVATAAPIPKPKSMQQALAAGQFTTEADAKAKCPSDEVVWVNIATKKFHFAGHDGYGKSKKGAYMCEADATAAGAHASKNEKQL